VVRTPGGIKPLEPSRWGFLGEADAGERQERKRASREDRTSVEEKDPEGRNPKSVTGMKQAREVSGGENRRGREKRRGRNVASPAGPVKSGSPTPKALKGGKAQEGCRPSRPRPERDVTAGTKEPRGWEGLGASSPVRADGWLSVVRPGGAREPRRGVPGTDR
jgi:hypothetical protein